MRISRTGLPLLYSVVLTNIAFASTIPPHLGRDDIPFYTDFRQFDFPFIETTLDVRQIAPAGNTNNLVPRAIILNLGENVYAGFDTELLRFAAIWEGDFVTPDGMAMLSYAVPLRKMPAGQSQLPRPQGRIVASTGLYPGWQRAATLAFEDPRPRLPDPEELGRGPLPTEQGRWQSIDDEGAVAAMHYTVGSANVTERTTLQTFNGQKIVNRHLEISPLAEQIDCVMTELDHSSESVPAGFIATGARLSMRAGRRVVATISPSTGIQHIVLSYALDGNALPGDFYPVRPDSDIAINRASESATTRMVAGEPQGAYAVDELAIPFPNPWQRRIRPMDIAFYPNGDAVMATFDGDVFHLTGLDSLDESAVTMKRIAAGLNEPQSIGLRGNDIFVFTRLGLIELVDLDGDGDTDRYKMLSNDFLQSAETRAFPLSMVILSDGSFLLSIGGQQEEHTSPHAGRVLHISPEGKFRGFFAEGLRNGYLAKIGTTDRIIATDQQGNWVPSTPMHSITQGGYYGYAPGTDRDRAPANVPLWIPHRWAQSGIDLVTVEDSRLGGLGPSILMVDFYQPRLLKILGGFAEPLLQAAALPLPIAFETPLIKGEINPKDGQAYFTGMQIWSSVAARLEGFCRLRALTPTDNMPTDATVYREGVLLQFSQPLDDPGALDPANYRITAWNYHRTEAYGSGQYNAKGDPGVDQWPIHTVLLNADHRHLFLAVPDMKATPQLEVQYRRESGPWQPVFFTINQLPTLSLERTASLGIEDFNTLFASTPAARSAEQPPPAVSVERGRELYSTIGCMGCHSVDGKTEGMTGPTLMGIYQTRRPLINGRERMANSNYLRDSLMDPAKNIVAGYDKQDVAMPSYAGVLNPNDVDSLIMFIETLTEAR
jgi:cytochrome c2